MRKKIMVRGISIGGAAPLGGVGLRQPTQNDAAPLPFYPSARKERAPARTGRRARTGRGDHELASPSSPTQTEQQEFVERLLIPSYPRHKIPTEGDVPGADGDHAPTSF